MAKVYLSSRWGRREEMRKHRETLVAAGHRVTANWLDESDNTPPAIAADVDLIDISEAEVLIAFTETEAVGYYTGGRFVELGYALARPKRVIVVGPRENVFCHLPEISVVADLQEAMSLLA